MLYERARIIARAIGDAAHGIIRLAGGLSIQVHDVRTREHRIVTLSKSSGHIIYRSLKAALVTHHGTLRVAHRVHALDQCLDGLLCLLRALCHILRAECKRVEARARRILRLAQRGKFRAQRVGAGLHLLSYQRARLVLFAHRG